MNYQDILTGINKYGSTVEDVCNNAIGVNLNKINEKIIIAPWWEPSIFSNFSKSEFLSKSEFDSIKVWNINLNDEIITYIKTGIGAPMLMDTILALGLSKCKKIVFIGSVGSLDNNIGIGDIVIPEHSICGDGASRYIVKDNLKNGDIFGEKVYPNIKAFKDITNITKKICEVNNISWHISRNFSTDTIFAQFAHLDEILELGCNVIEMETAAAFCAANIANISAVALFSVSDNTVKNKSLFSGRTSKEMEYRRYVRKEIFPQIIMEYFK